METYVIALTDESIQMVKDMIDSDNFKVKMRLDGKRDVDGTLIFSKEALTMMYNDYVASGALNNNFAAVREMFPCTIK